MCNFGLFFLEETVTRSTVIYIYLNVINIYTALIVHYQPGNVISSTGVC